jgi:hypothetical protein
MTSHRKIPVTYRGKPNTSLFRLHGITEYWLQQTENKIPVGLPVIVDDIIAVATVLKQCHNAAMEDKDLSALRALKPDETMLVECGDGLQSVTAYAKRTFEIELDW